MNPFELIKNFKIRYKLLFIYSLTFFAIISLSSLIIYSIVKKMWKEILKASFKTLPWPF